MASIFISDWKFGMDRRRQRVAGVPGTLWDAKNVVISRGGDIERAKRFVPTYALPAGKTFGLGAVRGQIYTFGSLASGSVAVPLGIQYQQLVAPSAPGMVQVLDARAAGGSLYVIARYDDGNVYHFYNGSRVTDWDALADTNTDFPALASYMADLLSADTAIGAIAVGSSITITATVPGTAFTISKSTVDKGAVNDQDITLTTQQANVAGVAEVAATGTVTITGGSALAGVNQLTDVTVNGVSLMLAPVDWILSNASTATAVAIQINNKTATHGYAAQAVGAVVTITAGPGVGATANGYVVTPGVGGNLTASSANMAGGVTAVAAVAQVVTAAFIGTFQSQDQYTITINGTHYVATGRAAGTGTSAYVVKRRVFSTANTLWEYCKLNTFTNWSDATASSGAGFLNISNESEGAERLVGAGTYIQDSAVFSRRNIRVYTLDTDATKFVLSQPIDNSGSLASRAILGYGTTDLFYLDEPGIRSLRATTVTGIPFVNDIGVAIDPFVRTQLNSLPGDVTRRACAVIEPLDGRFWLAIGTRIYVLSYFPGSQISAWTYFEPGFTVSDFARAYNRLYVRGGDTVYLYGGADGATYPNAGEMVAQVDLPFVATSPPGLAQMIGFDLAAVGEWQVSALVSPDDENQIINIGIIDGITYSDSDIVFPGRTTHVAFSLTCSKAGQASLSNMTVHTNGKEPSH